MISIHQPLTALSCNKHTCFIKIPHLLFYFTFCSFLRISQYCIALIILLFLFTLPKDRAVCSIFKYSSSWSRLWMEKKIVRVPSNNGPKRCWETPKMEIKEQRPCFFWAQNNGFEFFWWMVRTVVAAALISLIAFLSQVYN